MELGTFRCSWVDSLRFILTKALDTRRSDFNVPLAHIKRQKQALHKKHTKILIDDYSDGNGTWSEL